MQFADVAVLTINDQPISDDLQDRARAAFVLPGFVVDDDGFAVGMTGYDETIDALDDLGVGSPVMRTAEFRAVVAELSSAIELVVDGWPETRLERRNWTFDWDASDCAR